MKKIINVLIAVIAFAGAAQAASLDFNGNHGITNSTLWTATPSSLDQLFGSNYTIANGYAELTESSVFQTNIVDGSGTNSILFARPLAGVLPGTYNWSLDTRLTNQANQYNYAQVYLLDFGQSISLEGKIWNEAPAGSIIISRFYHGPLAGANQWHTIAGSFDLTAELLLTYDVAAFVFTGSRASNQILNYDNFMENMIIANVPEPATIVLVSSAFLLTLFRRVHI